MSGQRKNNEQLAVHFGITLGIEILILLALLGLASVFVVRRALIKEYIASTEAILEGQTDYLVMRNSKFMQQMRMYTMADVIKVGSTRQDIVDWLVAHRKIRSGDFESVMYCDFSTGKAYTDEGNVLDVANTEYFNTMKGDGISQCISNPFGTSKADSQYFVCKSVSINNEKPGFFAAGISLEKLAEAVDKVKIGEGGYAFLLDGKGNVMAYPNDSIVMHSNFATDSRSEFGGLNGIAREMIAGSSGYDWHHGNSGRELVMYQPFSGTDWSMALAVPAKQVFATSNQLVKLVVVLIFAITFTLIATAFFRIFRALRPLKGVDKAIQSIAAGNADLTQRLAVSTNNEIGSVTAGFNAFMEKLQNIIADIKDSKAELKVSGEEMNRNTDDAVNAISQITDNIQNVAGQIKAQSSSVVETAGAVEQIAQNIASLERMIETQSSGVTQASTAVVEMIENIDSVNNSVQEMSAAFSELERSARAGAEKQNDVNQRMEQIEVQSEMLQEANRTIASIASQTNLLAMNAAIEAAHAGEAGRGFSVVADEIRKLSETSSGQSKTIGEQLKKIRASITDMVGASAESTATFNAVVESIQHTDRLVGRIKNAMAEQAAGSRQINDSLHGMNTSTAQVRNAAAEMSEGNKAILEEVQLLQNATGVIEVSVNEMSASAQRISQSGVSLSSITQKMKSAIGRIDEQIDQFKS